MTQSREYFNLLLHSNLKLGSHDTCCLIQHSRNEGRVLSLKMKHLVCNSHTGHLHAHFWSGWISRPPSPHNICQTKRASLPCKGSRKDSHDYDSASTCGHPWRSWSLQVSGRPAGALAWKLLQEEASCGVIDWLWLAKLPAETSSRHSNEATCLSLGTESVRLQQWKLLSFRLYWNSPVSPPRIKLVATLTSMSWTSRIPAGAILRKVKTLTRAELKAMILAFLSQASLEYLKWQSRPWKLELLWLWSEETIQSWILWKAHLWSIVSYYIDEPEAD